MNAQEYSVAFDKILKNYTERYLPMASEGPPYDWPLLQAHKDALERIQSFIDEVVEDESFKTVDTDHRTLYFKQLLRDMHTLISVEKLRIG